ncbi:hypothetical protein DFJ73DRAFT_863121, partial [Zopfochytrium polystomum]
MSNLTMAGLGVSRLPPLALSIDESASTTGAHSSGSKFVPAPISIPHASSREDSESSLALSSTADAQTAHTSTSEPGYRPSTGTALGSTNSPSSPNVAVSPWSDPPDSASVRSAGSLQSVDSGSTAERPVSIQGGAPPHVPPHLKKGGLMKRVLVAMSSRTSSIRSLTNINNNNNSSVGSLRQGAGGSVSSNNSNESLSDKGSSDSLSLPVGRLGKVHEAFIKILPRDAKFVDLNEEPEGEVELEADAETKPADGVIESHPKELSLEKKALGDSLSQPLSRMAMKKIRKMERVVARMRSTKNGIKVRERSHAMRPIIDAFKGSQLIEWLMANCGLFEKEEAIRFAQQLLDYGYIISADYFTEFNESQILIFQSQYLWCSHPWNISKRDYLLYLAKRYDNSYNPRAPLTPREDTRRRSLVKHYLKEIEVFEVGIRRHGEIFESLTENEQRIFLLQEWAFWNYQRPLDVWRVDKEKETNANQDPEVREQAFEAALTPEGLVTHLERRLEYTKANLLMNRSKPSVSSKALVERCQLHQPLDPLVTRSFAVVNPYVSDDVAYWTEPRSVPSAHQLRVWCYSFADLIADPLGVEIFTEFLKTEFSNENLDFYLAVCKLDSIGSYTEFVAAAMAIFDEFVAVGASRELNITSGLRKQLTAVFGALKEKLGIKTAAQAPPPSPTDPTKPDSASVFSGSTVYIGAASSSTAASPTSATSAATTDSSSSSPPDTAQPPTSPTRTTFDFDLALIRADAKWRLPPGVFAHAQDHIYQLMAKDSYNRFLQSEILAVHLVREGVREMEGDFGAIVLAGSGKLRRG